MFFDTTNPNTPDLTAAADSYKNFSALAEELGKTMESLKDPISTAGKALQELVLESEQLNKQFIAGRGRIQEMVKSINEAVPEVVRLGGEFKDVRKTITGIAEGTRRQVVASSKDVKELFAASSVIGLGVNKLVESFAEVGYSYDKVSSNLSKSIVYVRDMGLNTQAVMKSVVENTDALSRFNFNNGVQGLTKMAAQASMLRVDMKKTLEFAEGVLDPDKAVEVASAFQRLGVSVGNLTDPFQLMNQSINDPSGLQNSLINATKQFTYFDEKTKSFKINPQGILTLKEMANATGMSAGELRKMALAAADMDSRLSKINTAGFKIPVSEEDKMMIANIAKMGDTSGEYEVSIKDERGYEYQKKLTELQEDDIQRLRKQQEEAPKTMEEIQRAQLNSAELMLAEMQGLSATLKSAVFGIPGAARNIEISTNSARDIASTFRTALEDTGFKNITKGLEERVREIRAKGYSKEKETEELEKVYKKGQEDIKAFGGRYFKTLGSAINQAIPKDTYAKQLLDETAPALQKIFGDISKTTFGGGRTTGAAGGGQQGQGPNAGIDFSMITRAVENATTATTGTAGAAQRGNVIINNPTFNNTPTFDISSPVGGISSPSELVELIRKGGVQVSEEMAKAVYNNLEKLGLVQKPK